MSEFIIRVNLKQGEVLLDLERSFLKRAVRFVYSVRLDMLLRSSEAHGNLGSLYIQAGWLVLLTRARRSFLLFKDVYRSLKMYIGCLRPRILREGVVTKGRGSIQA